MPDENSANLSQARESKMGQAKRDVSLENRSNRLKIEPRKEPYWSKLGEGQFLGYYRPGSKAAGSWVSKWRDPETGSRKKATLGQADDYADADGERVLSWAQANGKARSWFDVAAHEAVLVAGGDVLPTGPYTVAMAMEDYFLDSERRGVRGLRAARSANRVHILPELGPLEVGKLTQSRLERWQTAVAASPALARPRPGAETPNLRHKTALPEHQRARKDTANRVFTVLKAALNLALARRRVVGTGEAWREVKPFKGVGQARTRFLSVEDQLRIVNACPEDFRRLVQGALFTGGRYGELARAMVQDFNPAAGTLFLVGKGTGEGKPRQVVLTAEGQAFFLELTTGKASGELIFPRGQVERRKHTEAGPGWLHGDQSRFMAAACKAADLEPLTFHELRHSYASMLVNKGVPLAYVAAQLGHTDTRMVEKHYGHLAPSALADSIRALSPLLGIHQPDGKVEPLKIAGA
jgi:integrase